DRLAHDPVGDGVLRGALLAAQVRVAAQPRDGPAGAIEGLALEVARVLLDAPPRRLDRAPAVRRHDEVNVGLVEPLPELPPGRRAPVVVVEVDRGDDGKDSGLAHRGTSMAAPPAAPRGRVHPPYRCPRPPSSPAPAASSARRP